MAEHKNEQTARPSGHGPNSSARPQGHGPGSTARPQGHGPMGRRGPHGKPPKVENPWKIFSRILGTDYIMYAEPVTGADNRT